MKRLFKVVTTIIICFISFVACNSNKIDILGIWDRPVADNEIGVTGTESLLLTQDSAMIITNNLSLVHKDSVFDCTMRFKTKVAGTWFIKDGSLTLIYDASTFRCDTVAGGVKLYTTNTETADSVIRMMKSDLFNRLSDYYKSVYESVEANGPLILNSVVIRNDSLEALYGDSFVTWTRQIR